MADMPEIGNSLQSRDLDVIALTDPERIKVYATKMADQMNKQCKPQFSDLSDRIGDIRILTAAQGASFLEVHVIDPVLVLLISGFISVADDGYLDPPVEVQFPPDTSTAQWRLCAVQVNFAAGMSEANLVLTFEDKIAADLREVDAKTGGVKRSNPGETLGGFMKRVVDAANRVQKSNIKLVELIAPSDPNYTAPLGTATAPRPNPNKNAGPPSKALQAQLDAYVKQVVATFGNVANGPLTISGAEQAASAFTG